MMAMATTGSRDEQSARSADVRAAIAHTIDAPTPESLAPLMPRLLSLGIHEAHLLPGENGTLVDQPPTVLETHARRSNDTTTPPPPDNEPVAQELDPTRIVLGPLLGEGGMGLVHVADQPALKREVAVKTLRPERKTPAAVNALMREAWVTGSLEHPNIVPIHLVFDAEGDPRVVMKRIEGVTWDTLLDAPFMLGELLGRELDSKERLRFHLRILTEVCHAIHFAHVRGILHLDLKPENVMVGRFGEVYLLDWGIAVGLTGIGPPWLPTTLQVRGVRGTPSWMPPELAGADSESLGVAADVYLLGGLLHAVLVNKPRHAGETVREMLENAWESAPYPYRELSAPDLVDLAALANWATQRDPARRPASALLFRRALESHLEHQSSIELTSSAEKRLERLFAAYGERQDDQGDKDEKGEKAHKPARPERGQRPVDKVDKREDIRREFLECRFAFLQALQIWPENPRARLGLQRLLRESAIHALDHAQLERATECIAELSPRDPELEARLNALGQKLYGQRERLRHLERDADANAYHRQRSIMSAQAATLFIVWNTICSMLHRASPFALTDLLWINATTIVVFGIAALIVRRSLLTTATNRRLVILFGSGFFAVLILWCAAVLHGLTFPARALSVEDVVVLTQSVFVYFVLSVTFTMDGRVAIILPAIVAIGILSPLYPELAFEALGLSGGLVGFFLAALWWRPRGGTSTV